MIREEDLKPFVGEMVNIFGEKFPKYGDTWRTTPMEDLKEKLEEQVKKLTLPPSITTISRVEETKRTLAHIANYCALIFIKFDLYNSGSKKSHNWRPMKVGGD